MTKLIITGLGILLDLIEGGMALAEAQEEAEEQKIIDDTKARMQDRAHRALDRIRAIKKAGG